MDGNSIARAGWRDVVRTDGDPQALCKPRPGRAAGKGNSAPVMALAAKVWVRTCPTGQRQPPGRERPTTTLHHHHHHHYRTTPRWGHYRTNPSIRPPTPSRHPTREHVLAAAAAAAAAAAPPSELDQSRPAHLPISLTLPPHPFPHPELHRRSKNSHSRRHVRRRHTDAHTRARKTP